MKRKPVPAPRTASAPSPKLSGLMRVAQLKIIFPLNGCDDPPHPNEEFAAQSAADMREVVGSCALGAKQWVRGFLEDVDRFTSRIPAAAHGHLLPVLHEIKIAAGDGLKMIVRQSNPDREIHDREIAPMPLPPGTLKEWWTNWKRLMQRIDLEETAGNLPTENMGDYLWANAKWIDNNSGVTAESLRSISSRRKGEIRKRIQPSSSHPEYLLQDVERAFPAKAQGLVKKFLALKA